MGDRWANTNRTPAMATDHVHSCPRCYEDKPCSMACDTEPDLDTTRDGKPRGYHAVCDECETEEHDCERCHVTIATREGDERTPLCDHCAQEIATEVWKTVHTAPLVRKPAAVRKRLSTKMPEMKAMNAAHRKEAVQLRLEGWTLKRIGEKFDVSKERVRQWLLREERAAKGIKEEEDEEEDHG